MTGATGLVGTRLVGRLLERGDQLKVLTRRYAAARQILGPTVELLEGDPMQPGPWQDALADCDAVVHLAGENVFGRRWNEKVKKLLVDSRVQSTANVVQAIARLSRRPGVLVNASAIGYYGPRGDEELDEGS